MDANRTKFEPPRTLKGRRARRIWRELAQKLAASDQLHAGTSALLAAYASAVVAIERDPEDCSRFDLDAAQRLGRALGVIGTMTHWNLSRGFGFARRSDGQPREAPEDRPNFVFSGVVNMLNEGGAVQWDGKRVRVGSTVLSAGTFDEQIGPVVPQPEADGLVAKFTGSAAGAVGN
jgi:hypothetical protein